MIAVFTILVALAIAWRPIFVALSGRSGWLELATAHPDKGPRRFVRVSTIALSKGGGFIKYRGCADVSATEHGLRVAILLPLASRHPALLVPWERLAVARADESEAILQVVETPFVIRVHASEVIAQVRYWLDVPEPSDSAPL